jgi:hypothetical protein
MKNSSSLILILIGGLILYLGVTGKLGNFFADIFYPNQVNIIDNNQ